MFYKISLTSKEPIGIEEKKKYIDSFYSERTTYQKDKHKNQGFMYKFNSAIGFKDVESYVDNESRYFGPTVESPEGYQSPKELLWDSMRVGFDSPCDVVKFYIPKQKVKHPIQKYAYHTSKISEKFLAFLKKVFPMLNVEMEVVEEKPKQSLSEFALDYFFVSLEKEIAVTIEFSSKEKLKDEEMRKILAEVQPLANDRLGIAQFSCDTCAGYSNGEKTIHIEIVYLTWYGKDVLEKRKEEYGESLFIA